MPRVQLFLSTVSAEFLSYRERLRQLLTRPDVEVKVQEDFIVTGNETLEMLDRYIQGCDGVIHLVGDMTGAMAKRQSVAAIAQRYPELGSRYPLAAFLQPDGPSLSYTQWEAWLALHHNKPLFIATPAPEAPRDQKHVREACQQELQQAHLSRLREVGRYPGTGFTSQEHLAAEVLRSFVLELLVRAGLNPNPHTPHNLPERTTSAERFVGRAAELQSLAKKLAPEGSRVYLTGMGGVGKSELAVQHAYDHLEHYRGGIVRLDARQGLSAMAAQLVTFFRGRFPAVVLADDTSPLELLPVCWSQWPASTTPPEPVLMILDDQRGENLPAKQGDQEGYGAERLLFQGLPPRFRRLITQREPAPIGALTLELPLLERPASLELLALQAGEGGGVRLQAEAEAAEALCAEVGDLPLALVLLGARLAERPDLRLGQLLEELRAKGAEARALQQAHPELGAQRGVVEALLISWEPLSGNAKSLALLLSVMAPTAIPWVLVERCCDTNQKVEKDSVFADQQVELLRSRFLERLDHGLYRLHPLVLSFLIAQSHYFPAETTYWNGQLVLTVGRFCKDNISQKLSNEQINFIRPFIAHLDYVTQKCLDLFHGVYIFWTFTGLAFFYENQADFKVAQIWLEKCLVECSNRLGPSNSLVASSNHNLCLLMLTTHNIAEAERFCLDSLKGILSRRQRAAYISTAANLFKLKGLHRHCAELNLKALRIAEEIYDKDSIDLISFLNNAGESLHDVNELSDAECCFRQILRILDLQQSYQSYGRSVTLSNLALLNMDKGNCSDAMELIKKAKKLAKSNCHDKHPDWATILNNEAQIYLGCMEQGATLEDYSELESNLIEAIEINQTSLISSHPRVLTSMNNLALLYQKTDRLEEAETLSRRCLQESLMPDISVTLELQAKLMINLATIMHDRNKLDESESLFRSGLLSLLGLVKDNLIVYDLMSFQEQYRCILEKMELSELEIKAKLHSLKHPNAILPCTES